MSDLYPPDPQESLPLTRHANGVACCTHWTAAGRAESSVPWSAASGNNAAAMINRTFPGRSSSRGYAQTVQSVKGEKTGDENTTKSGLTLTDQCVSRLKQLALEEAGTTGTQGGPLLRIAVDGGGCSGFQYAFSLDTVGNKSSKDLVFERNGARIIVDDVSFQFVKGSTVDFVEEMIKSSFAISENPNADSGCGCGVSFAAK